MIETGTKARCMMRSRLLQLLIPAMSCIKNSQHNPALLLLLSNAFLQHLDGTLFTRGRRFLTGVHRQSRNKDRSDQHPDKTTR